MSNKIEILGIETNNLKNIDVELIKHSINLILGPSGSGKSSLAYDTIAKIGLHELSSMFSDEVIEPDYKVKSYKNMITTVPIQQLNKNNNIRSTIGTYFGINQSISLVYSMSFEVANNFFVLNKVENVCTYCKGIGYVKELDLNRIIDYNVPLEKCPIKCWSKYRSFYAEIIKQYCLDVGINSSKNFKNLTEIEKEKFLFGISDKKYTIKYKTSDIITSRTTKYQGIMTDNSMLRKFTPAMRFYADNTCPACKGLKYSSKYQEFKIRNLSIGEFMCTSFLKLDEWLTSISAKNSNENLSFSLSKISNYVKKAIELDLGHLNFHRAIPTLSGGEFQRLRLVQVFNTQLSDLLIVLDEPLAGLFGEDKKQVYKNIINLTPQHTVLIVDHHDTFITQAKSIISLGIGSGRNGGNLITLNEYININKINKIYTPLDVLKTIPVLINSEVYNYKGVNLEIAENRLNIITGKSGVGKTTLIKEYLPQIFDNYTYINQKPIVGKINSSVSTLLNINKVITEFYAKEFEKEKYFFSKLSNGEGACKLCKGIGFVFYGNDYQFSVKVKCNECHGTGFNKKLKKYTIRNKSILDVWEMTLSDALEFFDQNKKNIEILNDSCNLLLGHLKIGQQTTSLSGGENIRIKLLSSINSKSIFIGIDEPFRGLSGNEITAVIKYLNRLLEIKKTIIVIDHEEESFQFFSKKILLTNQNNILMGSDFDF